MAAETNRRDEMKTERGRRDLTRDKLCRGGRGEEMRGGRGYSVVMMINEADPGK